MQTTSKPFYIQFARFISTFFSPVTTSLILVPLIALYHNEPFALAFAGVTLLFISIGPLIYILIGVALGKFTDVDVSNRKQRIGPFLFIIASTLLGFFVLRLNHAPKDLATLLLITATSSSLMLIITLWWKISMHASSIAGATTFLTILYGNIVLPFFLLVLLVGWSRVVLKRHTPAQVIAGSLLSMSVVTLMLLSISV